MTSDGPAYEELATKTEVALSERDLALLQTAIDFRLAFISTIPALAEEAAGLTVLRQELGNATQDVWELEAEEAGTEVPPEEVPDDRHWWRVEP